MALSASALASSVKIKTLTCDFAAPLDGFTRLEVYTDFSSPTADSEMAFTGKTDKGAAFGALLAGSLDEKTNTLTATLNEAYGYRYVVQFKPSSGVDATITSNLNGKNATVSAKCQVAETGLDH